MFEYFRGCKRKAGLVTLLIACVITLLWARNLFVIDTVTLRFPTGAEIVLANVADSIFFTSYLPRHQRGFRSFNYQIGLESAGRNAIFHVYQYSQTSDRAGKIIASYECGIRHWVLVVPLTLMSAYLLLSKPLMKPKKSETDCE